MWRIIICTKESLGAGRWVRLSATAIVLLISSHIFFLNFAFAQPKANFKHYSTENGLSHDGVLCITKDKEGFMWFGTWDGINRFDGHVFTSYKSLPGDSSNLKNNKIRTIIEDKPGFLWVKTYDNLVYRFDKKKEEFLSVPGTQKEFKDLIIDRIAPVSTGDTWLLTTNQGLLCAVNLNTSSAPKIYRYSSEIRGDFHISGNSINFLFEDTDQRVWIGTGTGLSCLVKKNGRYYEKQIFKNGRDSFRPDYSFTCAAEFKGKIYFGTADGNLISFDNRRSDFSIIPVSAGTKFNALRPSKKGQLYISTSGKGIITLSPETNAVRFNSMPGADTFYSIYEDKSGLIWLEPERNGIIKFNPANGTFKLFSQKKDANVVSPNKNYAVFEDINGVLWASLKGGGLGYFNPSADKIEYFYNEHGSPQQQFSNIITALYADPAGILWISAIDGGVNKITFPGNNFNYKLLVNNSQNKSENEVRALLEDKKGRLWISTKGGQIHVFKNGQKLGSVFENSPGLEVGSVYSIFEDREGSIWLGTKGNGLTIARPLDKEHSRYRLSKYVSDPGDKHSLSSNLVYSVFQDNRGRVWVGTLGGGLNLAIPSGGKMLFRNSKNAFKQYPASCNVIRHLQQGTDGKIWVATTDGLVLFDPDKGSPENYQFLKYSKIPGDRSSLGNNDVQYIHRDRMGQMWVGTFGGGLNKAILDPATKKLKFRIYTRDEGLPNDIILSIVDDNKGNLWLATENGLSQFNRLTQSFKNYDSYDGLPPVGFSEAACFRSRSGHLYFGCVKGYIYFNPARLSNQKLNANMALTNIQLYNKDIIPGTPGSPLKFSLNSTELITLDYDQDVVSIDYTVLDYRAGQKVSYAYILKGYDKGWHYVKNQHKATYTNLPPGKYEFIVKGTSTELFNNIPAKSLKITVLPPPWLSIWAYIAYCIVLVILIEMARRVISTMIKLRNNVAVEHRLTDLKMQFFTNISHELRTPLTLIVSPLEDISKNEPISARGRENINIVNRNANRMIRLINQLLDFRKVQSGKMRLRLSEIEIVGLLKEISKYFTGLAQEKNIDLQINSDVDELYAWLDEEKIDIVIYNLLSNAFKFSPPNKTIRIDVSAIKRNRDFTITITDQGHGIPKQKLSKIFELYYEGDKISDNNLKGTGIGLALSKELIEAHYGTISADNSPEGGMIFSIELKTGKEHFKAGEADFVNTPQLSAFINSGYPDAVSDKISDRLAVSRNAKPDMQSLLLVEDNSELRKFLAAQLSQFYRVLEAADGAEGFKAACDNLPDLIISDVMMPNMDGIEMLDKIKTDAHTSHIPVILLTAKSSVESMIEGLKYGADFYITKPFHTDHILASVENLLSQRKKLFESLVSHDKKLVQIKPDEILITSRDEEFLKDVIRIVEAGILESEFNIDNVAEAVGVGRTAFYKKLKSLTGLAPVEFVRDMRLKRAMQLLDAAEYTVSEISYMTGFSSSGYFSTCFKEKYKVSPSEYMKNKKSNNAHSQKT
ncbi:two-component regulator propeller domain-containing protein [Pedobacter sp. P351]|uniref:hybrid sensor histidine kinase/response regulator transcription factor n=1 Tax=Pedobacter superstes TaxID=3133441 RepID=UPI00309EBD93